MRAQTNDKKGSAVLPGLAPRGWTIEDRARLDGGVWVTDGADADVDYHPTGHEQLAAVEDDSVWFAERNRLITALLAPLPRQFVEIGAGNGFVTAHLRAAGIDAVAVEPFRSAALTAAGRGVPTVCGLLEDLELPDGSIEAAGVFDVLEHLAHPAELLGEIRRVLEPSGRLVVSVPAMPSLWSQADVLAGHHRRYRRGDLIGELQAAGFTARSVHYAFGVLVPAVGLLRSLPFRLGRERSAAEVDRTGTRQVAGYGALPRAAARAAFVAERVVRRIVDPPLGTSLVGLFEAAR